MNIVAGALAGNGPGAGWRIGPDEAAANHAIAIQGTMLGRSVAAGPAGSGINLDGVSFTPTKADVHAVMHGPQVSPALKARDFKGPSSDGDGDGDGAPLIAHVPDVHPTMVARSSRGGGQTNSPGHNADETLIAHTLRGEGFDASEDGTGRGTPLVPVGCDTYNGALTGDVAATLGTQSGDGVSSGPSVLEQRAPSIAFGWQNSAAQGASASASAEITPTLDKSKTPGLLHGAAVRRLTPTECERLQGFPDDWTAVPFRGKPAADGPRYKALGNSWAVNCARWIGRRIAIVDAIKAEQEPTT